MHDTLKNLHKMSFNIDLRNSSKQQCNSKVSDEKFPFAQAYQTSKCQGKLKVKDCGSYRPHGPRQDADSVTLIHPKTSADCQQQCIKGRKIKDDELVKYMTNLPGYLVCAESAENSQRGPLNVGVLDWSLLEKWKQNKKSLRKGGLEASTSSLSTSGTVSCSNHNSYHTSHPSHHDEPAFLMDKHFGESEVVSTGTFNIHHKTFWNLKSFENGKRTDLNREITSRMGNLASSGRNSEVSLDLVDNVRVYENKKRVERMQVSGLNKKASHQRTTFDLVSSSSSMLRGNYGDHPVSSKESLIAATEDLTSKVHELQQPEVDFTSQHWPAEPQNVDVQCAKNDYLEEPQISRDESQTGSKYHSFSDDFAYQKKVRSKEFSSRISKSYPLPFSDENSYNSDMMGNGKRLSSDATKTVVCIGKKKNLEVEDKRVDPSDYEARITKTVDQEMTDVTTRNSRQTSSSRRFSFRLDRLSISFRFSNGSSVSELSPSASVKSCPVKSHGSICSDDLKKKEVNSHSRARSNPLRRIIDLFLKSKELISCHPSEAVLPSKRCSTSLTVRPIITHQFPHNGNQDGTTMKALVQYTIRNGQPMFQIVIDNNSSIMVATKKNFTLLRKDDYDDQHYTFYSVNEVKKKSGNWITQGSKEKHSGFVYDAVGHMKLRMGFHSTDRHILRECILFDTDLGQADHQPPKFNLGRELAAIVVKLPYGDWFGDAQLSDKDMLATNCPANSRGLGESEDTFHTTVILPGGVHSWANNGAPSPLIDRWKSGGSCDCGGWDIGCKLRVLSNKNQCLNMSKLDSFSLNSNSFKLFTQGGTQTNMAILTLEPVKNGIYSLEFDSSISLLQAFFTCVTIIICKKFHDSSETSILADGKEYNELTLNGIDQIKKTTIGTKEYPMKYASNPPPSPIGRA